MEPIDPKYICDREELRRKLIDLLSVRGKLSTRHASKRRLADAGLWDALVAWSSSGSPNPATMITEVLLRVKPDCVVCGNRCRRLLNVGRTFGFCEYCSRRCKEISQRGKPINSGDPRDGKFLPVHPVYGHDWVQPYRNALANGTVDDYERTFRNAKLASCRAYCKEYRVLYPERIDPRKGYYAEHQSQCAAYSRKFYDRHTKHVNALNKAWKAANPEKVAAIAVKRRAAKIGAVPPNLTEDANRAIEHIYDIARRLSGRDGIQYHVDHIVPISKGGMHDPYNLQIIPAKDNLEKGSKVPTPEEFALCRDRMDAFMVESEKRLGLGN